MKLPAKFEADFVTAIVDSREQHPLDLSPLKSVTRTLDTGDYSVVGLERLIAVERKSLGDLVSCVGRDRDRFEREVQRLLAFPARLLVVEAVWPQVENKSWRGNVSSKAVVNSLLGWIEMGLPVAMVGTHERAGSYVSRFLFLAARRRYREIRNLIPSVEDADALSRRCG